MTSTVLQFLPSYHEWQVFYISTIGYILCLGLSFLAYIIQNFIAIRRKRWRQIRKIKGEPTKHDQITEEISESMVMPPSKVMVILGSGGHTAEMLCFVKDMLLHSDNVRGVGKKALDGSEMIYIVANTDSHSEQKVLLLYQDIVQTNSEGDTAKSKIPTVIKIPRAREVGQSWITSFFTTSIALLFSIREFLKVKPDVILCNGPGTCVPLCVVAMAFNSLAVSKTSIVYIESVARVRTLSLSGKILYPLIDRFLVQWPHLVEKYPLAEYYGRLT